jgi:hypothetical protein
MPTLQEKQASIDAEIVKAMIASAPETWKAVLLVLERGPGKKDVGQFVHELSSPEGNAPVAPEMSLFEATYKLDALIQGHGGLLRRAEYLLQLNDQQWSYKSKFEYEEYAA